VVCSAPDKFGAGSTSARAALILFVAVIFLDLLDGHIQTRELRAADGDETADRFRG
jgi:hypothetical protein